MLKLKVKIINKIEELPQQEWDNFFPGVLENYYFFKTLDESSFVQFSFFYILVYENNIPVGAASCFIMDFPLDIAVNGPLKLFFNAFRKVLPKVISPKIVICGLPMGPGRIGITGDPGQVMEAIYGGLEKIATENKAALIFFKDFSKSYENLLKPFLAKGFSRLEGFPTTEMDLHSNSFGDYLKTLSRVSRDGLKRNFKKIDTGVKIDLEEKKALENEELSQVYGLYLQTYNKQELGFEKLPSDFFKNISRNMPQETRYFLWRIDGKLVAFALCFIKDDYFIDYYLGFDYSLASRHYLYFVRFRDLMTWCIEHRIKKYEMGATSYEVKRRLGFNFVRLYFYVKHRNRLINRLLIPLMHVIKPENFDPVFKQMNRERIS